MYNEIHFDRITGRQFKYLKAIHEKGRVTSTELADMFQISKPSINELINKLHESNIVQKQRSEEDKRVTYISLTPIGEVLATTNRLEGERLIQNLQSKITEEDIQTLCRIFDKLGDNSL